MRVDWEEILDMWEEKELAHFLPECLPDMDDAIYQRIEKQTLRRIRKERSRISRKQIAAAVICLVAILGIVGREPIQAAFEKLFHYLPGAGIYTNDTENTMYRAEMVIDHFEENGVQVRLKNVYGENQMVKLEVELHGDDLSEGILEEQMENSPDVFLKERYQTVLFYGGIEQILVAKKSSWITEEEQVPQFSMGYEVQVENPAQTYEVHIAGFDSVLSFTLVPDTGMVQPENIGASQTKNGITVTAGAEVTDEGIWFEYYVLSDETVAETDTEHRFSMITIPYGYFRWDDVPEAEYYQQRYLKNCKGEILYPKDLYFRDDVENGERILYEGTAEDFPLTFYQAALTGIGEERETLKIPIPETSEKLEKNIDFPYGTVTLEQVQIHPTHRESIKEMEIIYRIQPKEGKRKMYGVFMQVQEAVRKGSNELTIFPEEDGTYHFTANISAETKEIALELYDPYYWIVDNYTLVLEEPKETK